MLISSAMAWKTSASFFAWRATSLALAAAASSSLGGREGKVCKVCKVSIRGVRIELVVCMYVGRYILRTPRGSMVKGSDSIAICMYKCIYVCMYACTVCLCMYVCMFALYVYENKP